MHSCPRCASGKVHRSRPRSRWEILRKSLTLKRVFRCHACGWRGWAVDLGPAYGHREGGANSSGAAADAEDAENFDETAPARPEQPAELDINSLDANMDEADSKQHMIVEVPACDVEKTPKLLRP